MDLVILFLSFVAILVGAELFTNGIEWFGHKLELAEGAVGSVLAAVGTALPETTIPVVAILATGNARSNEVGVGAILGAPFMLSTLAIGVTGLVVLAQARRRGTGDAMSVDRDVLVGDVRAFGIAYAIAVGAAFLPVGPTWPKLVVAVVLLALYGRYVKKHFDADPNLNVESLNPLRLHRLDRAAVQLDPGVPRLRIVNVQVLAGVLLIVVGAVAFVTAVTGIARNAGVSELMLALIVAPIATELPEAFNAILWIRQGKDTLAMGNVTGAMVFQASIGTVVALVFAPTTWAFSGETALAFGSAGIAFLSTAAIFVPLAIRGRLQGRGLLVGGLFYALYIGFVAVSITRG